MLTILPFSNIFVLCITTALYHEVIYAVVLHTKWKLLWLCIIVLGMIVGNTEKFYYVQN